MEKEKKENDKKRKIATIHFKDDKFKNEVY